MRESIRVLIMVLAIALSGIVAGMAFAEGTIVYPMLKSLRERDSLAFFQSWFPYLGSGTRMFVQLAILAVLIAVVFAGSWRSRWLLIGAILCYAVLLIIVFGYGAPTGRAIIQMDPLSPPTEWSAMLQRSSVISALRTACSAAAFLLQIIALAARKT